MVRIFLLILNPNLPSCKLRPWLQFDWWSHVELASSLPHSPPYSTLIIFLIGLPSQQIPGSKLEKIDMPFRITWDISNLPVPGFHN